MGAFESSKKAILVYWFNIIQFLATTKSIALTDESDVPRGIKEELKGRQTAKKKLLSRHGSGHVPLN